ncbi:hypothetical protein [Hymenobacter sp. BRD67]|uniref:hypothetical protein n=1 Tax=Hymenobacter sp. BRD67 TaxID=2675877 RepID=UPI0015663853|nr:hypothetical protein [Hymenobacter sp. BRD67]QKG52348.1 hypothetical protein GKZ67_06645 [Hymenobacter sp. BRD67]
MSHNVLLVDCWILDEIETDYSPMWDLVSVLSQRQPQLSEEAIYTQLSQRLNWLFEQNYFSAYEGLIFNGDEVRINIRFSFELVKKQAKDWTNANHTEKQLRIYITDLGRKYYLENCRPFHFTDNSNEKNNL